MADTFGDLVSYAILCCFCTFILIALASALYPLTVTIRARSAARILAEKTNLIPLNSEKSGIHVWYGGTYQGRRFAIRPSGRASHYYSDGRRRISVEWGMFVAMECLLPERTEHLLFRGSDNAANPQTFDEAFTHESTEKLSDPARAALLAFVQHAYSYRLREGKLRLTRRGRKLRLSDRDSLDKMFGPGVLAGATAVLLHEFPFVGMTVEELTAVLKDMSELCGALEVK